MRVAWTIVILIAQLGAASGGELDANAEQQMVAGEEAMKLADFTTAIAHFKAAVALAPQATGPHAMLGLAYAAANRCGEAVPELETYVRLKGAKALATPVKALDDCRARLQRDAAAPAAAAPPASAWPAAPAPLPVYVPPPPPPRKPFNWRGAAIGSLVVGVVGLAIGAPLVAIDGTYGDCPANTTNPAQQCRTVHNTVGIGAPFLAIGVIGVIVSIPFFVLDRRDRKRPRAGADLRLTASAGGLGFAGSF